MSKTRTWQDNAAEFALLDKGEGWPFARLIACSVERRTGGPRTGSIEPVKVSANEFAEQAGTSRSRVVRYLDAWDKAAAQGLCTPSADLTPVDATTVREPSIPWGDVYDASKSGGSPGNTKAQDAAAIIEQRGPEAVIASMSRTERDRMATALRKQQKADTKAGEERRLQEELESGVSNIEGERLRDYQEARLHLVQRMLEASYTVIEVRGEWPTYRPRLGSGDLDAIRSHMAQLREDLGVLDMYLTDDIVGEVLRHEQDQPSSE